MIEQELNEKLQNAFHRLITNTGSLRTRQFDACLVALCGMNSQLEDARELFIDHDLYAEREVSFDSPF